MQHTMFPSRSKSAFSLVEMSIVLVILGLIIGGLMTAQYLLRMASIRGTIVQVEKFNASAHTFEAKYGSLPGDIPASEAATQGLLVLGGVDGRGDGDGKIEIVDPNLIPFPCNIAQAGIGFISGGETLAFWRHLSDAKMIDGNYGKDLDDTGFVATNDMPSYMPLSKIGNTNYFFPCSFSESVDSFPNNLPGNYYYMIGIAANFNGYVTATSPITAQALDSKIDDGKPNTGRVMVASSDLDRDTGIGIFDEPWAASAASGKCLQGGASAADRTASYNISSGGHVLACYGLMFSFQ